MNIEKIFEVAIKNAASDIHLVNGLRPIIRVEGKLISIENFLSEEELSSEKRDDSSINSSSLSLADQISSEIGADNDLSSYIRPANESVERYVLSDDDLVPSSSIAQEPSLPKTSDHDLSFVSDSELKKALNGLINKKQMDKFLEKKDLDFSCDFNNFRFRANLSFEKGNLRLVARIIRESLPTMESLDMPRRVYDLLNLKQGLILITGPTGSGKSTSLAAMINHINNNQHCNIVTLEDPIEFVFEPKKSIISQRELGRDMLSFNSGLRHVLRQDPNVIMVGEMRDLETISTAVTLAETGHLVLATLHTCNASQTIDRIIDIFPPHQQNQIKSQLSLVLAAVISQTLVPSTTGGRVAVRELLLNNSAVSNLIRDQKISQIKSVIETHFSEGMISYERSIKELVNRKMISPEIARDLLGDKIFST